MRNRTLMSRMKKLWKEVNSLRTDLMLDGEPEYDLEQIEEILVDNMKEIRGIN